MSDRTSRTAWDTHLDEFVVIERGEADVLRPLCEAGRLLCPIDRCPSPQITTRRSYTNAWGTLVVDGFRHLVAPDDFDHSPESLRHLDGKVAVREWLRRLGFMSVRVERTVRTRHRSTGGATFRRPDVVGDHPGGQKVAFEVQVSPLGADEWRSRTSDLRRRGWRVQWLWAWMNPGGRRALTTALRASADDGSDVWSLEPHGDDGPMLGWGWQHRTVGGAKFKVTPFEFAESISFDWYPMDEVLVDQRGHLLRPGFGDDEERLAAALRREQAEKEQAERRLREGQRRLEKRRVEVTRRNAKTTAEIEAERAERRVRAALRDQGQTVVGMDEDLEAICLVENRADDRVWTPTGVWKRPVVERLLGRPGRSTPVGIESIIEHVERNFSCNKGSVGPPVWALLSDLAQVGAVRVRGSKVWVIRAPRSDRAEQGRLLDQPGEPCGEVEGTADFS